MEINGTWYAIDTIKALTKVTQVTFNTYSYDVVIIIGGNRISEYFAFVTKELAEQSRNEIIKQLEK